MADIRLRELIRQYRAESTPEAFEALLHHYLRTQTPLNLLETSGRLSERDIPLQPIYLTINLEDRGEDIFGPWGLEADNWHDIPHRMQILEEVFADAGLVFPPADTLEIDHNIVSADEFLFLYMHPTFTRQQAIAICDAVNALVTPLSAMQGQQRLLQPDARLWAEQMDFSDDLVDWMSQGSEPEWNYPLDNGSEHLLPRELREELSHYRGRVWADDQIRFLLANYPQIDLRIGDETVLQFIDSVRNICNNFLATSNLYGSHDRHLTGQLTALYIDTDSWINPQQFEKMPAKVVAYFNYTDSPNSRERWVEDGVEVEETESFNYAEYAFSYMADVESEIQDEWELEPEPAQNIEALVEIPIPDNMRALGAYAAAQRDEPPEFRY